MIASNHSHFERLESSEVIHLVSVAFSFLIYVCHFFSYTNITVVVLLQLVSVR